MAVKAEPSAGGFVFGTPESLFEVGRPGPGPRAAVSPDGRRFLVASPEKQQKARHLELIVNWPEMAEQGSP